MGAKYRTTSRYPAKCLGTCGRTVRPSRTSLADHPGTVCLSGLGRCGLCREAMSHNGQARPDGSKTVEENRRGVEAWLESHWRPSKRVKVVQL